jgi:DNA polymerase-4
MNLPAEPERPRQILHVDMDAFFASVEQLDDPTLRGRPVLVGGLSKRGVVAAASYEARSFGVRSAMPMVEALRRCPKAVVRPGRRTRYAEISSQVFGIFGRFTPLVEALSLDEAFLDVTASQTLFGDGEAIAQQIKRAVREEVGLTASAGVAPCKLAAKIASDLRKPDGLVVVPADVGAFLADLPVERMWGIGPVGAERMRRSGFATIGDLARNDPELLESLLGSWGRRVHALANGCDDRPVVPGAAAKSVGAEETFETDLHRAEDLHRHLLAQCDRVAQRLFVAGLHAQTVVVKVKLADFRLRTRRTTLPEPVCDTDSLFTAARHLLQSMSLGGRSVRLVGVSVAELSTGPRQGSLWHSAERHRRTQVAEATAKIRARYGASSVTRATLLQKRDEE